MEPVIVARSAVMRARLALAARAAASDVTVLVTGESGTGKELLARAIHAGSAAAARSLVAVNCAAIPEALLESELFGYRRGAFTGAHGDKPGLVAAAAGGTLFLDEVAELPLVLQGKLLRFLQDGSYFPLGAVRPLAARVRVVAATNADLRRRVAAGAFRPDLYYRLAVLPIHVPPLRERPEDIAPLVRHLLARLHRPGAPAIELSPAALAYLEAQPWPGNVRELENAVARALVVCSGRVLTVDDFRDAAGAPPPADGADWTLPAGGVDLPRLVRDLVATALERTHGNLSAAARLLGLSRPALRYRVKKYRLERGRGPRAATG
jgi:transcriptional regulator with PAS, ATPase and Fis domain